MNSEVEEVRRTVRFCFFLILFPSVSNNNSKTVSNNGNQTVDNNGS